MQISDMLGRYNTSMQGAERAAQTEQASMSKNQNVSSLVESYR